MAKNQTAASANSTATDPATNDEPAAPVAGNSGDGAAMPALSAAAPQDAATNAVFRLERCYLKDLSLEQPNSPRVLLERGEPKLEVNMQLDSEMLEPGHFEATVAVTVTATVNGKTLFLIEGKQAGIFEISNVPEQYLAMVLAVNCSQIIYPYLRAIISDTALRAGFPPVYLDDLNFQAMFEQRQRELARQGRGQAVGKVETLQ